jgi:hypothetical protein
VAAASPLPVLSLYATDEVSTGGLALTVDRSTGEAATTFEHDTTATQSRYISLKGAEEGRLPEGITLTLQSGALGTTDTTVLDIKTASDVVASGIYPLHLAVKAGRDTPQGTYRLTLEIVTTDKRTDLSVTGVGVAPREYDGTTDITVTGTPALRGVFTGDAVSLGAAPAFALDGQGSGTHELTVQGSLSGIDAFKYILSPVVIDAATGKPVTDTVTPRSVSITGVTAEGKTYDGSTTVSGFNADAATIQDVVAGDRLSIDSTDATAAFATKSAGADKTVNFEGFTFTGADAANYTLSVQPTATATITPSQLTLGLGSLQATSKTYDGTTTAETTGSYGALSGIISPDSVSVIGTLAADFDTKDAGTNKAVILTGLSLAGDDAANYTLSALAELSASIDVQTLVFTGAMNVFKAYDGTTAAPPQANITVASATSFAGMVQGEGFSLSATGIEGLTGFQGSAVGDYDQMSCTQGAPTLTDPTGGALASNYELEPFEFSGHIIEVSAIALKVTTMESSQNLNLNKYFANGYSVDWGDGSAGESKADGTTLHPYTDPGTYTVVLTSSLSSEYARWTFMYGGNQPGLVPTADTTVDNVEVSYMPAMGYFMTDATTAPNHFFFDFNYQGALTSLPEGSFDTSNITTATGENFFGRFNASGALTSLPEGSFIASNIATAGSYLFILFNTDGSLTSLPESFAWPTTFTATESNRHFFRAFNSPLTDTPDRTAQSIIEGLPTPTFDIDCFSSNWLGYDELADNWKA